MWLRTCKISEACSLIGTMYCVDFMYIGLCTNHMTNIHRMLCKCCTHCVKKWIAEYRLWYWCSSWHYIISMIYTIHLIVHASWLKLLSLKRFDLNHKFIFSALRVLVKLVQVTCTLLCDSSQQHVLDYTRIIVQWISGE